MTLTTMTLQEFHAALDAQSVERIDLAFICPACGTIQSMRDLVAAGAGKSEADVERYIGFSCVGRWTGAGTPRREPDGYPCNWTLGGLFQLHLLEVIDASGNLQRVFEPASPEAAQAHARKAAA